MMFIRIVPSPLGKMLLASDGDNLTGLWFEGQKYFAATLDPDAEERELPVFERTRRWLDSYFAGENPPMDLPLAPKGSEFRQEVWREMCKIPYGKTATYGGLSLALTGDGARSAQAVGGAVAHNPISVIIPCHRVVGAAGSLTGYAGGIEKKIRLLTLEGISVGEMSVLSCGTAL